MFGTPLRLMLLARHDRVKAQHGRNADDATAPEVRLPEVGEHVCQGALQASILQILLWPVRAPGFQNSFLVDRVRRPSVACRQRSRPPWGIDCPDTGDRQIGGERAAGVLPSDARGASGRTVSRWFRSTTGVEQEVADIPDERDRR
jgi:hypothetical protein